MKRHDWPAVGILFLCGGIPLAVAESARGRADRESRPPVQESTCLNVPEHPYDLILSRPTRESVTLTVLAGKDMEGFVTYGVQGKSGTSRTPVRPFEKGRVSSLLIRSLQPDARYQYQFHSRTRGAVGDFVTGAEYTFHTQRPPGTRFAFTVTADSHLDEQTSADLYTRTLRSALGDRPDFHVDLGDTFMTEKHASREAAWRQYLAQRYYLGLLGHSAPVFCVLGNHDGEAGRWADDTADSLAVWANASRKECFPNPLPDSFYTGNTTRDQCAGLLEDYYAWEWGDALFVVLDPYWFTPRQRARADNWGRTLGEPQYQWLKRTLDGSHATLKFVFIHQLVGGRDRDGRGGAEAVGLYEWGGRNPDGMDAFAERRPGWPAPIHDLLVRGGVSIVFHGHDHLYAKQDVDGIVYQEVPQPAHPGASGRLAEDYGYTSGTVLGGCGYLRVTLTSRNAKVDYIRTDLPPRTMGDGGSPEPAHSYVVLPRSGQGR